MESSAVLAEPAIEISKQDLAVELAVLPSLNELSASCRSALAAVGRSRSVSKGVEILHAGELSDRFFILLAGRLKALRSLPTGRGILALFGPGDLVGAVAALSGKACEATLVALVDSRLLEIERAALFTLFKNRPELVSELMPLLLRPLVECQSCVVELSCFRVETRFAKLMLKLSDSVGQPRAGGTLIPIVLSRQELAEMTGTTVETAIRVMSRWRKRGVVDTRPDGFLVCDRAVLEQAAGVRG